MATVPDLISADAAILTRIIQPDQANLAIEAAQALLQLRFDRGDLDRLHTLTVKNQDDELTSAEQAELASYLRVSSFLDLMHAKAHFSLRQRTDELRP